MTIDSGRETYKASRCALKIMYIRHRHYRKRGAINRMNKCLGKIVKRLGHDEWLNVIKSINNKTKIYGKAK
jgi:hypothetical protein